MITMIIIIIIIIIIMTMIRIRDQMVQSFASNQELVIIPSSGKGSSRLVCIDVSTLENKCWVPAHVGSHRNERADGRAKAAAAQP